MNNIVAKIVFFHLSYVLVSIGITHTSIPVLQGQTHFDDLNTKLVIEIANTEHLRPKPFASWRRKQKYDGKCQEVKRSLFSLCC